MRGIKMEDTVTVGWFIVLVQDAICVEFLHFLYLMFLAIPQNLVSPRLSYDLIHSHTVLILIFLQDPL
jgi:hypothetical protein